MQLIGGLTSHTHYSTYYEHGLCYGGCPPHAHCEWAFCNCDKGHSKGWGRDPIPSLEFPRPKSAKLWSTAPSEEWEDGKTRHLSCHHV